MHWLLAFVIGVAACGGSASTTTSGQSPGATSGAIAGLARDQDSGDPVASAEILVRAQGQLEPLRTTSSKEGIYGFDHLASGRYTLTARYAGQPIEVVNIEVRAPELTVVDLVFTLGRVDPIRIDFTDPESSQIVRYKPKGLAPSIAAIEGTVSDTGTRDRIAGAVITLIGNDQTQNTVSDAHGRYRFETMPGVYTVTAYYSIGGQAQVEVRRSGIDAAGAEVVVVPMWIESGSKR
ncbi:MAG: carboxypeptidase regulatory-like domain-containing protein [Deltaproteobacteria bacterium]|nr:carboxypeptidase regulatory-like domain-containing protein [Deltaproteobacteria bacterium]